MKNREKVPMCFADTDCYDGFDIDCKKCFFSKSCFDMIHIILKLDQIKNDMRVTLIRELNREVK